MQVKHFFNTLISHLNLLLLSIINNNNNNETDNNNKLFNKIYRITINMILFLLLVILKITLTKIL